MKKKIHMRIFFLYIFSLVLLSVYGCRASINYIDAYKDYYCYDYHLTYLDSSEIFGKYSLYYDSYKYDVLYRRIKKEDINNFVAASIKCDVVLTSPEICVLQNPDTYFPVVEDWTIEKIQFYQVDINSESLVTDFYEKDSHQIIYESTEIEYINNIKSLILQESYSKFEYDADFYDELKIGYNEKRLYMRVIFSESDNIVWETEVCSYVNNLKTSRRFSIDMGDEVSEYYEKNINFVEITKDNNLYYLLCDVIDVIQ